MISHARALLTSSPEGSTDYLHADLRDTAAVLTGAARTLDFRQPVAILLIGVLHFVPDADDPYGVVARLMGAMAPGSYLVIGHGASDIQAGVVPEMTRRYNERSSAPITLRTRDQVARFFDGLELVGPGLVPLSQWWPPDQVDAGADRAVIGYCGMARKEPPRRRWPRLTGRATVWATALCGQQLCEDGALAGKVLSHLGERGLMGRDIQAVRVTGEDRRKYRDKVQRSLDVFARMLRERRFEASPSRVGVEIELNLVDASGAASMRNAAVLDAIADPAWATELGQFNLEINVPPRRLEGAALADLEQEIRASLNAADDKARGAGSRLVMVGILPTLAEADMHEGTLSANDRYRVLNDQIFAARGEDLRIAIDGAEQLLTHAGSITPEAACTSVQLHVQVSPEVFAAYWNAAQAIAGVQVALAANSPFLFGRQLWDETRITLFEQATDTRPDELKHQGVRPAGVVR